MNAATKASRRSSVIPCALWLAGLAACHDGDPTVSEVMTDPNLAVHGPDRTFAELQNPHCNASTLVDDFEGAAPHLPAIQGRQGTWFVVNDESPGGVQVPAPGSPIVAYAKIPENGGSHAFRMTATGFHDWGALVGVALNNASCQGTADPDCHDPAKNRTYDVSAYRGLSFYARSLAGPITLNLFVPMDLQHPPEEGGVCNENISFCGDPYAARVEFDDDWKLIEVLFSDLEQYVLEPVEWDPSRVMTLLWSTPKDYPRYDLLFDAVCFMEAEDGG